MSVASQNSPDYLDINVLLYILSDCPSNILALIGLPTLAAPPPQLQNTSQSTSVMSTELLATQYL